MKATPSEIEKYLRLLEETPHHIAAGLKGVDGMSLQFKPDKKSSSANDILAHLHSCVDIWERAVMTLKKYLSTTGQGEQ